MTIKYIFYYTGLSKVYYSVLVWGYLWILINNHGWIRTSKKCRDAFSRRICGLFWWVGILWYYGKYVFDCMSNDHEGLDDQVRPLILYGLNWFRDLLGNISIDIFSFSIDDYIPSYSTNKESQCFYFYCEKEYNKRTKKIYVHDTLIYEK